MEETSRAWRACKWVIKACALLVIFGIIAFLVLRIILAGYYPDVMQKLYPSEELRQAYAQGETLNIRRQRLRISYDDPNYSLFMASNQFYCPETGEFQITLRYNISTLEELQKDFDLPSVPAAEPALFDVSLVDNLGNRVPLSCVQATGFWMYQYMKFTTSNADFSIDPGWMRVEIYYRDAVNYEKEAYSMIPVYEKEMVGGDTVYPLRAEDLQP